MSDQCVNTFREKTYKAINGERDFQDGFKANWAHNNHPSVGEELLLAQHYLAEAQSLWVLKKGDDAAMNSVRKVLGVLVRAADNHGLPERAK